MYLNVDIKKYNLYYNK